MHRTDRTENSIRSQRFAMSIYRRFPLPLNRDRGGSPFRNWSKTNPQGPGMTGKRDTVFPPLHGPPTIGDKNSDYHYNRNENDPENNSSGNSRRRPRLFAIDLASLAIH